MGPGYCMLTLDFIESLNLISSSDVGVICTVVVYPEFPITRTTHGTWVLRVILLIFIDILVN